jgi:hypothetical protein
MKAIIIRRALSPAERERIFKLPGIGRDWHIYTDLESHLPIETFKEVRLPEDHKRQINYRLMDLLAGFGDKETGSGPLVDLMKFDGASLWYYQKYRAYFDLQDAVYQLEELRAYSEKYEEIVCYGNTLPPGINDELPSNCRIVTRNPSRYARLWKLSPLINYVCSLIVRSFHQLIFRRKITSQKHLILDLSMRQSVLDYDTLKRGHDNYIFAYLFRILPRDFAVINESVQPNLKAQSSLSRVELRKKSPYSRVFGEYLMLKGYLNIPLVVKTIQYYRMLKSDLAHVNPEGFSMDERAMLSILQKNFPSSLYYLLRYKIYDRFFRKLRIKTVTTTDENSPGTRCILDAARHNGVITVGVQHGTIHELHPAYMFSEKDHSRGGMPDYTLVWGQYYRDLLMEKGHYPGPSLVITGQIRTDIISKLNLRNESAEHPAAAIAQRTIVFASQPQQDPALRKRAAEDVINSMARLNNCRLIIKLHPAEKDPAYYLDIARKANLTNVEISTGDDLYDLISRAFAVITCFSTVGIEVVYFKKPLLVLDHLRQDIQNYCREGVGIQLTNADELTIALTDLLDGRKKIDEAAYDLFIAKYAYRIDGQAASRTFSFISGLA